LQTSAKFTTRPNEAVAGHPLNRGGFTLVELLAVIAVIALLLAILLPALSRARDSTRVTTCMANLRQITTAITLYADEYDAIPHGPMVGVGMGGFLEPNDGHLATSQVMATPPQLPRRGYMALGLLLDLRNGEFDPEAMVCPGDDTTNREEELPKLVNKTGDYAFSSYLYRQLDQVEMNRDNKYARNGRLSQLGVNSRGTRATALVMDLNSVLSAPGQARSNHEGEPVNVGYFDNSVLSLENPDNAMALRDQDFGGDPPGELPLSGRRDELLQQADEAYQRDGQYEPL
jgi:prepilin-type N-terminal cleavage/methylation domain-containing protein